MLKGFLQSFWSSARRSFGSVNVCNGYFIGIIIGDENFLVAAVACVR